MHQLLLVEDDQDLAKIIELSLKRQGYQLKVVHTLNTAREQIRHNQFALVIIDRLLPDGNGLDLVAELELRRYATRILILTTIAEQAERVAGLQAGADDYLVKPFSHAELLLRVQKLCCKQKLLLRDAVSYQDITLYSQTGELIHEGRAFHLRPKEARIFECLVRHQGFIVTIDMILSYVWGDYGEQPQYKTVAVYIRRLRMALRGVGSPVKIQSVRGVGYKLA